MISYRLVCADTPDRYASTETKLDANLWLSSTIIRSLWMTLLRCSGGAALALGIPELRLASF